MTVTGAAVPRVVAAEQLVAANSLSALTRHTGAVAGPLLAALVVMWWAVAKLPAMAQDQDQKIAAMGTLRCLSDGFRYLAGHRVLVAILAVDLAAMVFAVPHALFPELA